jgi:hypothetical protein
MSSPANSAVLVTLLTVLIICTGYAAGRLHQWYRAAADRDEAYQEGYDTGARSTFSMAARIAGPRRDKAAVRASAAVRPAAPESPAASSSSSSSSSLPAEPVPAPRTVASPDAGPVDPSPLPWPPSVSSGSPSADGEVSSSGRHLVPDELIRAATFRLAPDRVARARVHGAVPPDDSAPEAPGRPSVPKPRSF